MTQLEAQPSSTCSDDEKKEGIESIHSGCVGESSNAEYRRHNDEPIFIGSNADTKKAGGVGAGAGTDSAFCHKNHCVDSLNFGEGHAVADPKDGGIDAGSIPSSIMPLEKSVADGLQLQQERIHTEAVGSVKARASVRSIPNLDKNRSNRPQNNGQLADVAHRACASPAAQPPTTAAVARMAACTDVSIIATERQRKIVASIEHRRKLLTWVRRVRTETQKLRGHYSSGDKEGFIAAILLSKTNIDETNMQKRQHQLTAPTGTALPTVAPEKNNREGALTGASASREIADFQTVINIANRAGSMFKRTKSSVVENSAPSAPRDLRRGSSVGKRMATAASALANEGCSVSITTLSTVDNSGVGGGRVPYHPSISSKAVSSAPVLDSSSQRLTMKQFGKQFQRKQFQNPHHSTTEGGGIAPCSALPAASLKTALDKQKKVKKRPNSLKKGMLGANINGGVSLSLPKGESLPQQQHHPSSIVPPKVVAAADKGMLLKASNHFRVGASIDSINQSPSHPAMMHNHTVNALVPSVAAVKLLERRDMLAARLNSLFRKRHLGQNITGGGIGAEGKICDAHAMVSRKLIPGKLANDGSNANVASSPVGVSESLSASGITEEEVERTAGMHKFVVPLSIQSISPPPIIPQHFIEQSVAFHQQDLLMPLQSPRLPPCVKTHWDIVLEEMRWMAADFHEERKWKVSAGNALSNTIRKSKSRRVKRSESSALLGMLSRNRTPVSFGRSSPMSKSRSKSKSTISPCPSTGSWLSAQCRNNPVGVQNNKDSFYLHPAKKDVDDTRKISRLLSICILDHWDSCCGGDDLGLGRIEKLKACFASFSSDTGSPRSVSMANCDQSTPQQRPDTAICNKILEPDYDEITSRMEILRQSFNTLKERFNIDELALSYKGTGMPRLSHGQLYAVHVLESLWKLPTPTIGSSAIESCDKERGMNTGSSPSNRDERKLLYDDVHCCGLSAIVGGGLGVGKTVAVGALLWKNRTRGPQLVVCSPCALMRWRHELNQFKGLYGKIYGRHNVGTTGCDLALPHMESEVVLCDYGSFFELAAGSLRQCKHSSPVRSVAKEEANSSDNSCKPNCFASFVLDLRHPSSSLPGMDGRENVENKPTDAQFSYVKNVKWWIQLNNFIARCCPRDMKRLIIEHTDILSGHRCFHLINDNLGISRSKNESVLEGEKDRKRRTQHEMLAMKVAFIFHPRTFLHSESCGASIGKRVILWAKHQAKRLAMSTRSTAMEMKAPLVREDKDKILTGVVHMCNGEMAAASSASFVGYRHVLETSLRSVYDMIAIDLTSIEQNLNGRNESGECSQKYHPAWELRMCSLSRSQQIAYDKCCSNVTQEFRSPQDHGQIADYLVKLRKICIHSNLNEIILKFFGSPLRRNKYDINWRLGEENGSNLVRNLAGLFSEANVDVAKEVIKKSTKMKELLHVLICECGLDFFARECHEFVTENIMTDAEDIKLDENSTARKKMQKVKKKVLILATLVEAQLLTSLLLSSVGIHHEVLVSSSKFAAHNTAGATAAAARASLDDRNDSNTLPLAYSSFTESASAWAWSQDVVSQFNSTRGRDVTQSRNNSRLHHYQSLDILIASPKAISPQSCGIFPSSANVIISIDEDWSGREAPHVISISSKIRRRRQLIETQAIASPADSINMLLPLPPSDCRFIKLVCQSTCEDKFLCEGNCRSTRFLEQRQREVQGINSASATRSSAHADASKINRILLCPIKAEHKGAHFNIEGYLVPPSTGVSKKAKRYSTECHHIHVGSNILRYGNNKLCSVLCCASIESDVLFLPTKGKQIHQDSLADNINIAFAWALFNSENDESSSSERKLFMTSIHYLSESGSCSTAFGISTATSCSASSVPYIWRHLISLKRSSPVTTSFRSKRKTISLMDYDKDPSKNADNTSSRGALSKSNMLSSSNCDCRKEVISGDSFDAGLLMYMPDTSPIPAKKRKFSLAGQFDRNKNKKTDDCLLESMYSFYFSSHSRSSSWSVAVAMDGNDGCEPLIYFPTFIHSILHTMQSDELFRKHSFSGVKRKEFNIQINDKETKRSKIHPQERLAVLSSNDHHRAPFPDDFLRNMNARCHGDTFEANLHSAKDLISQSADSILTKLSLAPSLRSVSPGRSCFSLKSIILITHKKQPSNNVIGAGGGDVAHSILPLFDSREIDRLGGGTLHRKLTRQHDICTYSSSLPCTSYFRINNFHARCHTIREGLSYNSVTSSIGHMRLKSRLSNSRLISFHSPKSYNWLPFDQAITIQRDGKITSHGTVQDTIHDVFYGAIHGMFHSTNCDNSERSHARGITLPVGVNPPRFAKNNFDSLRGSTEAWNDMEDLILRESVSLKAASSSTLNMKSVFPSSIGSIAASVERGSFVNQEAREKEMVVHDNLSPFNLPQRQLSRNSSFHWIAKSRIAPMSSEYLAPEKGKPFISSPKRIQQVSKRSRLSSIPIPASTPTHSSHSESVQTARANMLAAANGITPPRHEMWPLELLDYVKKQKIVANRQPHQQEILVPSSSSSHHHVPYHPHNIHQHQAYHSGTGQVPHHQPQHPYQGQTIHNTGANKTGVAYQIPQPRVPTRLNHHHHRQTKEMKKGST